MKFRYFWHVICNILNCKTNTQMKNDKELKILESNAIAAYKKADEKGKALLSTLFEPSIFKQKPITERIDSLRHVCEELGEDYDVVFSNERIGWMTPYMVGFLEATYIARALNEGVIMDITDGSQAMYYPYLRWASGRGLSVHDVYYGASATIVAPCLCMKEKRLVEWAFEKFPDTYAKLFGTKK